MAVRAEVEQELIKECELAPRSRRSGAEFIAQLIECFPSMHGVLGLIANTT